jgi:hypothetical protein
MSRSVPGPYVRVLLLALLALGLGPVTIRAQGALSVCPDPQEPCQSRAKEFAPYELSFRLPGRLRRNVDYKSLPFYAVVLKVDPAFQAGDDCDGGEFSTKWEQEREQVQRDFPDRKVFVSYQCPDMGALSYLSNGKPLQEVFMAVYGGQTESEARRILLQARLKFPRATVTRMRVVYNWIVQ